MNGPELKDVSRVMRSVEAMMTEMDALICSTPTGEMRELETEVNIFLMMARDKLSSMALKLVNLQVHKISALTSCAAGKDGDCFHASCPQTRDGEPVKTGRHCPLDNHKDE